MRPWWVQQPQRPNVHRLECLCVCHPVMLRPEAVKDHRCEQCWEDSGKPWADFLEELSCGT